MDLYDFILNTTNDSTNSSDVIADHSTSGYTLPWGESWDPHRTLGMVIAVLVTLGIVLVVVPYIIYRVYKLRNARDIDFTL